MKRAHIVKLLAVAAAAMLACETAQAQPGGRRGGFFGRGFGGGSAGLLRSEYVQDELHLTADQKSRIEKILEASRESMRELFSGARDLSEEERRKRFAQLREKMQKANAEAEKKIDQVLDDGQRKRLQGIQIQLQGIRALTDNDVARAVGLGLEQKQKIEAIFESLQEKTRELFSGGFDRERFREMREKMQKMREEADQKVMQVLTDAQKKTLEDLKGKEIDRSRLFQRGGRDRDRKSRPRRPDV